MSQIARKLFSTIMTELISVNFEVFGEVQGVFFRKYTLDAAKKLELSGFVKNTPQGTVVGTIQGKTSSVEQMKHWLRNTGSPQSRIDRATFADEKPIDKLTFDGFKIVR